MNQYGPKRLSHHEDAPTKDFSNSRTANNSKHANIKIQIEDSKRLNDKNVGNFLGG